MRVAKAHGLGNDFLLVAEAEAPAGLAAWVRRACDRHRGLGADGVLLHAPAPDGVRMRLINADGGEAEISGNGLRCLAAWAVHNGWAPPRHQVHTAAGPRAVEVHQLAGCAWRVQTDLGEPVLDSRAIPVTVEPPQAPVVDLPLWAADREVRATVTSLGNPHCAVFLEEPPGDETVAVVGAALERHPAFPRRTNVEFVTVLSREKLRVRFWERGVGPTAASGTGAASAAVAAILQGLVERRVEVECDGGVLAVAWPEGGRVSQVGEVELVFAGEWLADGPARPA